MKKTILVSAERGETRVAVLEAKQKGGKTDVAELYIERRGRRSIVGNIYKGKVDNVLPGMEAAFVDIGLERNGFLHVDEIVLPGGEQAPKRGRGSGHFRGLDHCGISTRNRGHEPRKRQHHWIVPGADNEANSERIETDASLRLL